MEDVSETQLINTVELLSDWSTCSQSRKCCRSHSHLIALLQTRLHVL